MLIRPVDCVRHPAHNIENHGRNSVDVDHAVKGIYGRKKPYFNNMSTGRAKIMKSGRKLREILKKNKKFENSNQKIPGRESRLRRKKYEPVFGVKINPTRTEF